MTTREPVDVDGIPVELSAAKQKLWDAGGNDRAKVRAYIRDLREKEAPDFEPLDESEIADVVGARHFQDD